MTWSHWRSNAMPRPIWKVVSLAAGRCWRSITTGRSGRGARSTGLRSYFTGCERVAVSVFSTGRLSRVGAGAAFAMDLATGAGAVFVLGCAFSLVAVLAGGAGGVISFFFAILIFLGMGQIK